LEGSFPTLDVTRRPVSTLNGQRSGSPGPLMVTDIVRHIFPMERPIQTSNLVYTDGGGRRPSSDTGAMTSKVKGQSHTLTSSIRLMPLRNSGNKMLYLSLEAGGGILCRPNPAATLLVCYQVDSLYIRLFSKTLSKAPKTLHLFSKPDAGM